MYPLDWIEERSGLVGAVKFFLFRKVPSDINWFQTLGSATLTAFIVQALTGVILAMYYQPGPTTAYPSIVRITNDLFAGWLVRGMHRWGASVFIILMFLHMGRVFLFGAYKFPRELTWLVGVGLLALRPARGIHGLPAPVGPDGVLGDDGRDQPQRHRAVHRALPRAVPPERARTSTPTRCRASTRSTCWSCPGAIIGLIVLHILLVIRLGVTSPPWSKEAAGLGPLDGAEPSANGGSAAAPRRPRTEAPMAVSSVERRRKVFKQYKEDVKTRGKPFFPYAMLHDTIMSLVVVCVIVGLAVIWKFTTPGDRTRASARTGSTDVPDQAGWLGKLYDEPADPGTISFVPRPDWYFYFLFYLLRIFKWPASVILGTIGIPTIALILLALLPFYDRRDERRPSHRPVAMVAGVLAIISMATLTWKGATAKESLGSEELAKVPEWAAKQGFADNPTAIAGAKLFAQVGCLNCHTYLGAGGSNLGAPDLSAMGAKGRGIEFQIDHLKCPSCVNPGSPMPPFARPRRGEPEGARDVPRGVEGREVAARRARLRIGCRQLCACSSASPAPRARPTRGGSSRRSPPRAARSASAPRTRPSRCSRSSSTATRGSRATRCSRGSSRAAAARSRSTTRTTGARRTPRGSAKVDAYVVCPCSSGTLGAIASGQTQNLIQRAARSRSRRSGSSSSARARRRSRRSTSRTCSRSAARARRSSSSRRASTAPPRRSTTSSTSSSRARSTSSGSTTRSPGAGATR